MYGNFSWCSASSTKTYRKTIAGFFFRIFVYRSIRPTSGASNLFRVGMLTQHLEKCNEFINLDPIERQVFTAHYDRIRVYVIDEMRRVDDLFNKIFRETQLSGSYADKLKVSKPNEYDVLMILELPVDRVTVGKLGYVQIKLAQHWRNGLQGISDHDGFLIQNRVLEWLRRIVQRIFPNPSHPITIENYSYKVSRSVSGPANNLKIQCCGVSNSENDKFSIDLVAALEFTVKDVWKADVDIPKKLFLHESWNAVPKPRKSTQKNPRSRVYSQQNSTADTLRKRYWRNQNINRNWICSYAAIERELIHGVNSIKPLIRIFKKIRDTHEITNLKSYYIKQIFIHQLMLEDAEYWDRSLGDLFSEMLDVIIQYLEDGELPFYWHKKFDLFHNYDSEQIDAMRNKFERIKHEIYAYGPDYIYKVILTESEQRQI